MNSLKYVFWQTSLFSKQLQGRTVRQLPEAWALRRLLYKQTIQFFLNCIVERNVFLQALSKRFQLRIITQLRTSCQKRMVHSVQYCSSTCNLSWSGQSTGRQLCVTTKASLTRICKMMASLSEWPATISPIFKNHCCLMTFLSDFTVAIKNGPNCLSEVPYEIRVLGTQTRNLLWKLL